MLPSPHVHCLCARSHVSHWHHLHSFCLRPRPGPHWQRQVLGLLRRSRQQCVAISGCVCSGRGSARVHRCNSNASDSDGRVRSLRAHALQFLRTVYILTHVQSISSCVLRCCSHCTCSWCASCKLLVSTCLSLLPLTGSFPVTPA